MIDDDAPLATSKSAAQRRGKKRPRSATSSPQAPADYLWIGSVEAWVPEAWPAMHPLVGQLVSEDFTWRLATLQWQACRPNRFQRRDRKTWRATGESLAGKRERLRATARELGLRTVPQEKPAHWWSRNRKSPSEG